MAYPRWLDQWLETVARQGAKQTHIAASAHGKNRAEKRMAHPVCQGETAQSGCALAGFHHDGRTN
jgi:hypothetical protein